MLDLVQDATLLSFVVLGGFLLGYVYREGYELYERRKEERRLFPEGTYRTYNYKGSVTLETGTLVNLKLPPFDKIAGLMVVDTLDWKLSPKTGGWEVTVHFVSHKPPKILEAPYKVETGKEKIVITSPGVYQIGPLKADGRVTVEKKAEPDKSWETPPVIYEEKVNSASEELQKAAIEEIYGKGYLEAAKEEGKKFAAANPLYTIELKDEDIERLKSISAQFRSIQPRYNPSYIFPYFVATHGIHEGKILPKEEPKEKPKEGEPRGHFIHDYQGAVAYVVAPSSEEALKKFMDGECNHQPKKGRYYYARLAGQPTSPPPPPPMY